jgi:hypothetical protein
LAISLSAHSRSAFDPTARGPKDSTAHFPSRPLRLLTAPVAAPPDPLLADGLVDGTTAVLTPSNGVSAAPRGWTRTSACPRQRPRHHDRAIRLPELRPVLHLRRPTWRW